VKDDWIPYKVNGVFHANAPRAIAQAALGGLGIGMSPLYSVEDYLANGELICILEQEETVKIDLNALYPQSRHLTVRIRALIDHLVNEFSINKKD